MDYGIVQHASVRLWVVCNADVYLPEPKCLTGELGSSCCGRHSHCDYWAAEVVQCQYACGQLRYQQVLY